MLKHRLFKNILALCIALIMVCMAVICVIWLGGAAAKNREADFDRSCQMIAGAKSEVDRRLVIVASMMEQFAHDPEISAFMRGGDDVDAYAILQMRDKLSNITTNFAQLGFRMSLFNPQLQLVVTSEKSQRLGEYLQEVGAEPELFQTVGSQLAAYGARSRYALYPKTLRTGWNGAEQLLLLYKSHVDARADLNFFVLFDKDYLLSDYTIAEQETFYLTYQGQPLVTFHAPTPEGDEWPQLDAQAVKRFMDTEERGKPVASDGNILSYETSSTVDGLGYFLIHPNEPFFKDNPGTLIWILLAMLLAMLIGLAVIYIAVCHIYRPVGTVVEEIRAHSPSDVDGGNLDEMEIIHNTFTDIRSSHQKLEQRLSENRVFLREKMLSDLLYGVAIDGDPAEQAAQYDLAYLQGDISVTVVEYLEIEHMKGFLGRNDVVTVKKEILDYIRTDLQLTRFELFEINETQFVIITAGYRLEEVRQRIATVVNVVEVCYDIKLLGVVGTLCQSLADLRTSFYDALNMLSYKALFSGKNVITAQVLGQIDVYYYPLELEKQLISYIQLGRWEPAEDLLNNIMERNKGLMLDDETVMELKFAMIATLKRLAQLFGRRPDEVFERELFERWQFTKESLEELRCSLLVYLQQLCAETESVRAKDCSAALRQLLDYIHQNYQRDIALSDAADYYEISQGYVGKLFRENLHTTFKDYLNQYRIDMAKTLLVEHPTMKINEIAQRVGFISAITFNRVFKRIESIAPGEYRKNHAGGQEEAE